MISEPQHILIIRLSAIGDVVMASALLPALRRGHPKAHIAWLVEPAAAELLCRHPLLDELIVWPRGEWQRLWRKRQWLRLAGAILGFVRSLRRRRFDMALDTQGLLKSGLWAYLSGARQRIGLGSREGSQHLMTRVLPRPASGKRIGAEYLHLAEVLNLPVLDFPMSLPVDPTRTDTARRLLQEQGIHQPYAVICPFTTRPQKHWFEDRWATLAPCLQREMNLPVLMLGGPGDRAAAERIQHATPGLHNLAGRTSLGETVALIHEAALLIGVDTGLTHMGIALKRPTLALFGSTCPYLDPAVPQAKVLYHPLACSPCRRHPICHGEFNCMRLHDVDTVLYQAYRLLEQEP